MIGFSFRDQHINKHFEEFIKEKKDLIVISPNCKVNYSKNFHGHDYNLKKHEDWVRTNAPESVHFLKEYVDNATSSEIISKIKSILNP